MTDTTNTEVSLLLESLKAAERKIAVGEQELSARKKEEAEFHDVSHSWESQVDCEQGFANKRFYTTTDLSKRYLVDWLRTNAKDRVFLDYACGAGAQCIDAARHGAALAIGIDISPGSIDVARRQAEAAGVGERTHFFVGDCENTGLPDNSIDTVLCSGMLHHLDLSYAFPELRRILKPGGKILAFEALNYNPVIRMYRQRTPEMRTTWEKTHILSLKEVRLASYFFEVKNVKFWHLFSILATPLRKTGLFQPALTLFNALDRVLLRVYPISLMAWVFTFELQKRLEE